MPSRRRPDRHTQGTIQRHITVDYGIKVFKQIESAKERGFQLRAAAKKDIRKSLSENEYGELRSGKLVIAAEAFTAFDKIRNVCKNPDLLTTLNGVQYARTIINDNVRVIRNIKESGSSDESSKLALPSITVGNEFTFTNVEFQDLTTKEWKNKEEAEEANFKIFHKLMLAWNEKMSGYGIPGKPMKDKYKQDMMRFEFDLGLENWSYDVTVDDGCVEIITPPVQASKLEVGEIAMAMDRYIFGIASKLKLDAGQKAGGGHINLGRVGLEGTKAGLIGFISAFYEDAAFWMKLDGDAKNAPFPEEVKDNEKAKSETEKLVEKYQGKLLEGTKYSDDDVAKDFLKYVLKFRHKDLPGSVKDEDVSHYQALNLDHFNAGNLNEQRVEVRRVPAQESRIELLGQLSRLLSMAKTGKPPK